MRQILSLTKRNMKVFLRDKTGVFFSLLSPLLVLVLFILFLGDLQIDSVRSTLENYGVSELFNSSFPKEVAYNWLIAGVIGVSCITVSFSCLAVIITDREKGIENDYKASPISNTKVYISYILGVFFSTLLIMAIVSIAGILFLAISGSLNMALKDVLVFILGVILGSFNASLFAYALTSFIKTTAAHGAFTGLICAISGFLIGAYMPLSAFPKPIQYICGIIPGSHSAGICRSALLNNYIASAETKSVDVAESLNEYFSMKLNLFGNNINQTGMFVYLIISTIIFLGINIIILKLHNKKR
ncbi:MAG: ABC transporter permease [Acholeplasmatales bacterium]|nr:ABC transporter permease [Acholeplasmatales bacterium]